MDTVHPVACDVEVSFNRHNKFVGPADLTETLFIIGVGATGSHLALTAARMGFTKFVIYDHDEVEAHNLPNQVYDWKHVGMKKVDALEDVLMRFNHRIEVQKHAKYFTSEEHGHEVEGILVIAVDSMKARKDITEVFDGNPLISLVIESRLGFEFGEVNIIDPMSDTDVENWRSTLLDDNAVPEGPCGLRICVTTVGIIASYMVQQICMQKSQEKSGEEWTPHKKMVMQYDTAGMTVFNI